MHFSIHYDTTVATPILWVGGWFSDDAKEVNLEMHRELYSLETLSYGGINR